MKTRRIPEVVIVTLVLALLLLWLHRLARLPAAA